METIHTRNRPTQSQLKQLHDRLLSSGSLFIHLLLGSMSESAISETKDSITSELILSGFVNCKARVSEQELVFSCEKPSYERGQKFSLKTKQREEKQAEGSLPETSNAWEENDDDERMNEDELLTKEDFERKTVEGATNDGVGCAPTRKPCKDCTCGRKEEEENKENNANDWKKTKGGNDASDAVVVVKMDLENDAMDDFKSSCGNCALGDAFRCAGCPYLGKPAFKDEKNGVVLLNVD